MNNAKKLALVLLLLIVFYLLIKLALFPIIKFKLHYWSDNLKNLKTFWGDFLIDTMAIGGLFAIGTYYKHRALKIIENRLFQAIIYSLILFLFFSDVLYKGVKSEVFAVLFGVLVYNVSNGKSLMNSIFKNPVFDFLGRISYGIYMYHSIFIVVIIKLMLNYGFYNNLLLYLLSFILTISISHFSYKYFESYFLTKKAVFTVVKSEN